MMFEITYQCTKDDLTAFMKSRQNRVYGWKFRLVAMVLFPTIAIGLGILCFLYFKRDACGLDPDYFVWTALIASPTYIIVVLLAHAIAQPRLLFDHGHFTAETRLVGDDQGLHVQSEFGQMFYNWRCVRAIEKNATALEVMYEPAMGIVVPYTAFKSEDEQNSFFNFVRERLNSA